MTAAEAIAQLPDDQRVSVVIGGNGPTMAELKAALASSGPVYITTKEASKKYSRSPRWWARAAHDIHGAYIDRYWRLPVQGCEEHLASLIRPRRRRGPWYPKTSHPLGEWPKGMEAR